METIYTAGTGPWAQPEKSVQPYRSGLVRVEQAYTAPTSTIATAAATFPVGGLLDVTSPALDGLYIYPEPQWREQAGGFSEINVAAYGRTRTDYTVEQQIKAGIGYQLDTIPGDPPTVTQTEVTLLKTYFVCRYVTAPGEANLINTDALSYSFKLYNTDGTLYPLYRSGYALSLVASFEFSESINFGYWSEWTVIVTFTPTWTATD